jgi:hypothetical protein
VTVHASGETPSADEASDADPDDELDDAPSPAEASAPGVTLGDAASDVEHAKKKRRGKGASRFSPSPSP